MIWQHTFINQFGLTEFSKLQPWLDQIQLICIILPPESLPEKLMIKNNNLTFDLPLDFAVKRIQI